MHPKESRFQAWRERIAARLARSSRIFLLGLVVACGVEVLVDWNQTLSEINTLRDQIRQKGKHYAGLLSRIVVDPMMLEDSAMLDRLTAGIIDDEDAVYVRISDVTGKVVYERTDPLYERWRLRHGKDSFRSRYAYFLDRDSRGLISDPEHFKQRLAHSRYRDIPQIWADAMERVLAMFAPPDPLPQQSSQVVYQDRLRDENRRRDDTTSWAIAPLLQNGSPAGAVLVAFDLSRTNRATRNKYLKGTGMVIFFVSLILVQNIITRRDKLRLLDIETRHADTKKALAAAFPHALVTAGTLSCQGAIDQAKGCVDAVVWDAAALGGTLAAMVVDPDGDGIDAAAVGLHTLRTFRSRRAGPAQEEFLTAASTQDPERVRAEIAALGAATQDIPLARPIAVLLVHIEPGGSFTAVTSDFASLQILDKEGGAPQPISVQPLDGLELAGIVGPLSFATGTLPLGGTLLCACAGRGSKEARIDGDALARYLLRNRASGALNVADAAIWMRGKSPMFIQSDIAVVTIRRA